MALIHVRYFASVRELLGRAGDDVEATSGDTPRDLWLRLTGQDLPTNILVAVNQEYQAANQVLKPGDEVAFFPPVTGG